MVIHPDGRIEGTPEELAAYQRQMQAAPKEIVIEKQVPVYVPYTQPNSGTYPMYPWDIWCGTITAPNTSGPTAWN